ncbi:AEL144Wp [Eremothecium gossypii ATCC 10895]|uniref:EKC/KEOPS complex subunit GON7 n=1 Tax=Eremothecium gossypii (strain ATCC 10895 / CBS 109.51 / FGSC 9923 / NRRL Y-1056) TaxID=284811 RepID=GON7_EREGS|nr:AEL144Wp [Eremothecium gossypii ATCC 10895]Q758A4.1 RecName: Full=EKC/KEOPS complex subunit GON7 [Eremothecium gossypii ATCC 10895]AAS52541.1 AEL144Wp [Eremothecium gossypii ATCC 10895]AEY96841.1 FAEL144Wp [Eremothecium gossypii FDAG1]
MQPPTATYCTPEGDSHAFTVVPDAPRYRTTDGTTSGPSAYVLQAGQIDRDRPSPPKLDAQGEPTALSRLRMHLTGLQDDINSFLTAEMQRAKNKKQKIDDTQEQRATGGSTAA